MALLCVHAAGILSAQQLRIFCEIAPPAQQYAADGSLSGYAVDMVREIQRRTGGTEAIEAVPWVRGYEAILHGGRVVLFSMIRTKEREGLFTWIGPVHEKVMAFYARADSAIAIGSLEEAKALGSIGVYVQDVRDIYLTAQGFANLERVADNTVNLRKLMAGRLDLVAADRTRMPAEAVAAGFKPSDFREVLPFLSAQSYIALSKDTPAALAKAWSEAFEAMRRDGSLKRIYRRYLPEAPLPGPPEPPSF